MTESGFKGTFSTKDLFVMIAEMVEFQFRIEFRLKKLFSFNLTTFQTIFMSQNWIEKTPIKIICINSKPLRDTFLQG